MDSVSGRQPVRVLQSVGIMNHGGIEHFIMNLYRRMDRNRVQFDFMERTDGPSVFDEEIEDLGGRIYHCASPDKHPARAMRFYRGFFSQHPEYKIVHEHRASLFGFMGCLRAASYEHVPSRVVHAHSSSKLHTGAEGAFESLTDNFNKKRISSIATDYFACSDLAAAWMFPPETGCSEMVKVIPNGIDTARFAFDKKDRKLTRSELGIPEDAHVIGSVGRLERIKNQIFLLDIVASFPESRRPYLLILGDGSLRSEIERRADELGIREKVILAGLQDETWRFYAAMDVFCMPSLCEGLPVSAVEAQASGLPGVLSDRISKEADLGGDVTFAPLDIGAEEWARLIARILGEVSVDSRPQGASRVADAGFDIAQTAEWLQDFYIRKSTQR